VVGANGQNFRQLTSDDTVKIFPPAWFDNNVVIFAGTSTNATCPDDLCFYDFTRSAFGVVDTDLAASSNIADMPLIQRNGGTTYLFYRFDNGSTENIRVAIVTYDGTNFNDITSGPFPSPNHKDVALTVDGAAISNNVDYYDVSPRLHIVFYEFGSNTFQNSYAAYDLLDNLIFGDWEPLVPHSVDGYVGNPSWDEDPDSDTFLHALRATVDWVP
jgi:hypothetical protein